jgi:hypothetical protein
MQLPKTVKHAVTFMKDYLSIEQYKTLLSVLSGEESSHFQDIALTLAHCIETMPVTYEQDGKGEYAVVFLHYFSNQFDFYLTERDINSDQSRCFGLISGPNGIEYGYICLPEILANNVELDYYFHPRTVAELRAKRFPNTLSA